MLLHVNPAFERQFGYEKSGVKGKELTEYFKSPPIPVTLMFEKELLLKHENGSEVNCFVTSDRLELPELDEQVFTIMDPSTAAIHDGTMNLRELFKKEVESPVQSIEKILESLARLIQLSVKYYQITTGESRNTLAEQSGLWHITMNGSTPRAYLLEHYLDPIRIPKKPRWALVLKISDWVLEECSENIELKEEILNIHQYIEKNIP